MPRPRKVVTLKSDKGDKSNSSSSSESSENTKRFQVSSVWKGIGFALFLVAVYCGVLGYLETRVNTPFSAEKVVQASGLAVPERYWGSYRPGVYFGMKSREPYSPVFGIMWYEPATKHKGIRHWCDQGDNLDSYGWIRHDGVNFGEQKIKDGIHTITTSFVKTDAKKKGGQWTARIEAESKHNESHPLTIVWYVALDTAAPSSSEKSRLWLERGAVFGRAPYSFRVAMDMHKGKLLHQSQSEAHAEGLNLLKEKLYTLLRVEDHPTLGRTAALGIDHLVIDEKKDVNFVAVQLMFETPFSLDIMYTPEELAASAALRGSDYSTALKEHQQKFDEEFENKFKLSKKGYSTEDVGIARLALSNMLGGVGYFYGAGIVKSDLTDVYSTEDVGIARSALSNMLGGVGYFFGAGRVQSDYTKEPVPYWRAPLYTAVPSRSFFPRGFLWDEGFHGLLLARWSPDIQLDIAAHWLDLMNVEGWVPREQILGAEALARVPQEFVVQSNAAANPPALLLQLARLARPSILTYPARAAVLHRMYTRLQAWFQWFLTTQKGEEPTSFRWRGRVDDGLQLNPKTLTSGLDDYPRASHPSSSERHVDLRCWMYAAADALITIGAALQQDTTKYEAIRDQLGDEDLLNELHWSSHTGTYADYGLHTDEVKLVRPTPSKARPDGPEVVRSVTSPPQLKLVTSAFGYVSLFPMLLKVLKPESPKLAKILEDLDKPELLWSPFGLRSLSKSAPLYMKRNTAHDPPYWRGQVWLNINYLALSALKHYSTVGGPNAARAAELHDRLRDNVVGNVLTQYKVSGYLWEQYSGQTGAGSGCKPFTGWTALVVLAMAEDY